MVKSSCWLLGVAVLFCGASSGVLLAGQDARSQTGEFVQKSASSAPGTAHSLADTKHALQTMEAVFAAYAHAAPLDPPRGFQVIHNSNADARETPRGRPIPVGTLMILLAYDSTRRLPNGRFAPEEEGPVLGSIEMNQIDCDTPAIKEWGDGAFYYLPAETSPVHGWPVSDGYAFMTKRTQPRWLPVSTERMLKAQLDKARKDQKEVMNSESARPQNTYDTWVKGRDERLRSYQKTHDELAKINKQQADDMLARMLESEKLTEKTMAAMAQQTGLNQMIDANEAKAAKAVKDLEDRLNSLSPSQRAEPAGIYFATDGVFPPLQVVPAATKGARAVVYPNPDFFDRSIAEWEAQSICVGLTTGPNSKGHFLYPTIQAIWNSLDWDAIAKVLK
jgi:hypothetical protein